MNGLFEYRDNLDHLHFTSEQKARMTAKVKDTAGAEAPSARRPIRRTAILAVTVAAVLTTGGAVFATGQAGKLFAPIFGTAQTEIINKIGRPIGAEATNDGITVTADAIIGDKYNACIIYTIKREDGSPLGLPDGVKAADLAFEKSGCDLSGGNGSHGTSWFMDGDTGDGGVRYAETISAADALKLGQVNAEFHELQYSDPDTGKMVTLSDGEWNFSFQADYEDSSLSLPAGETFPSGDKNFTITGISVSPVAMYVEYKTDGQPDWGNDTEDGREPSQVSLEMEKYLGGISVILTKKDGTTLDLTGSGGSVSPSENGTVCTKNGVFGEIIPVEDMESISVGGVEIPVSSD